MRRWAQAIGSRAHASGCTADTHPNAHGNPPTTSGRFCRRIQPERPHSGSVSPGQRNRCHATSAENRPEVRNPWRNQGPFPANPPRSRGMRARGQSRAGGCCHRQSRGVRTQTKPQQPSARQRERNPLPHEQGDGENSHPTSVPLLTSAAITASTPPHSSSFTPPSHSPSIRGGT